MPTISYDTQAVLAGDKVRFQGQEVAFVIATDEYIARDALAADRRRVRAAARDRQRAQGARPRRAADPRRQGGPGRQPRQPAWEAGDEEATDRAFAEADTVVVKRDIIYPRCHPAPLETCGMIADFNPKTGQLDIYNGNQAPHAHRTVYAHVAGLAEHMIRIRCNDIGGGFGNKVPVYPGLRVRDRRLDRRRRPGEVDRGPLGEPDVDRVRARLHHAARRCAPRTARSPACGST